MSSIGTVRKLKVKEVQSLSVPSIPSSSSIPQSSSSIPQSSSSSLERNTSEQLRLTNITLLEENAELRRRVMAIKKQLASNSNSNSNSNDDDDTDIGNTNEAVSNTSGYEIKILQQDKEIKSLRAKLATVEMEVRRLQQATINTVSNDSSKATSAIKERVADDLKVKENEGRLKEALDKVKENDDVKDALEKSLKDNERLKALVTKLQRDNDRIIEDTSSSNDTMNNKYNDMITTNDKNLQRIKDLENELNDMNAMKDAIEANWESSLYDLSETRSLAEIDRNEYHKLKIVYTDLLDLKNAIEAKGNDYEVKYESMSAQYQELQQQQQQQEQLQRSINTTVASSDTDNDNTFATTSYVDSSKPKVIDEKGSGFGFEEFIKLKKENRILKLQIASLTENSNIKASSSSSSRSSRR